MATITFDNVPDGFAGQSAEGYTEAGYRFVNSPRTGNTGLGLFGIRSSGNGGTAGTIAFSSPSIAENSTAATSATSFGRFTATNGSAFDVASLDLDQLAANNPGNATNVETLIGTRADGTTVTQSFTVNGTPGFQTFNLTGFTNLVAFDFNAGSNAPFTQLDNIVVTPTSNAPCYCTGTRILTESGEVAVEDLAIGDVVVTASGAHRPIRWIGTRGYAGRFANANPAVLPICVKAGALADGIPTRDLLVSPDHALYLDGLLVPAHALVNGATIVKAERVEAVTYWHVELDDHDVLLAEGAPAESFVDDGGRMAFHNAASYRALYPHRAARPGPAVFCAPRVVDGHALEAVRRRLALRAGVDLPPAPLFGALRGHIDLCEAGDGRLRVAGWARDEAHPDGPVCLDIVVDGALVALAYADGERADLAASGLGDGLHAFDLTLVCPLDPAAPHAVTVRRSADRAVLGSLRVEAARRAA